MLPEYRPERIFVNGEWYILCSSVPLITRKLSLKGNDAFLVVDALGDIPSAYATELGYYWRDTRFLSLFELYVNGARPVLLSSAVDEASSLIRVEMTNTDFKVGERIVQRTSMYIGKDILFRGDALVVRLKLRNLCLYHLPLDLCFKVASDFRDMFEVRGVGRRRKGELLPPEVRDNELILSYRGLDGVLRRTICLFPEGFSVNEEGADRSMVIAPKQTCEFSLQIEATIENPVKVIMSTDLKKPSYRSKMTLFTSSHLLNALINRCLSDLEMMLSDIDGFAIPMAGIPWYCTVFGRDSLITAYQMLPWFPEVAENVLRFLAKYQSDTFDDFTDSEPGKILHELRRGEMANLRELPFVPYYGSVDATLLFIITAAEYLRCTGDISLIKEIWESLIKATEWMQLYGDVNGDGFIEYITRSPQGLRNQGWKDSHDSIHHSDGTLAEPPIAVVEVQGYRYRALMDMAYLAGYLGFVRESLNFERDAKRFARSINSYFWMEDKGFYGLALDKSGKLCRVISSNAGHLLFSKVVPRSRARKVVARLMGPAMFSGYGIRTLSSKEVRYNPMSYHNGSVWPHDCAIIMEGMVHYGFKKDALRLFSGLIDAFSFFEDRRIPELFCGFAREDGKPPVPYPVACSPQAWASASLLLMLRSLLGFRVDASPRTVIFDNPLLPEGVDELVLENWETPYFGPFSFRLVQQDGNVSIETLRKPLRWKVVAIVG